MPKVSVCLAVYKTKPEYLKECIESILNQTFTDFEFLIIDDCPEDKECEKIIKSYTDNRIKYYRNEKNLGISGTRNRLLDLAQGEYIAVMDHDDISLPTRFEKQVNYLDIHPECGVVSCWYERFPNLKIKKKPENNKQIIKALKDSCPLLHPAAMIRKSELKENHIKYEEKFTPAEDYALWCRLVGKTSFYNVPEVLFRYRDHETNESKKNNQKMKNATKNIRENILQPNIYALKHSQIECKKISVIIPVYNVEKFLGRCLDSVFSQTFTNWEAICINDGSTDNSLNILERYAEKDTRIKIFSQKNQGSSVARNNGMQKMTGDYVCFIDADDYIEPNFLMDLYHGVMNSQVDIAMTTTKYIKGKKVKRDKLRPEICISFRDKINALPHGGACNKIYKSDLLKKNDIIFPIGLYWEDNLFTLKSCFYADKMAVINGSEYNYVNNPTSNIRNVEKIEKRQEDCLQIAKMIMDFVSVKSKSKEETEAVTDFCLRSFISSKDLISVSYYEKLIDIFSDNSSLRRSRRKQLFKHFLKNFLGLFKVKKVM